MQTNVNEEPGAARRVESLRLELECCQKRLAQIDSLFTHVADAFFVLECDGRILDVNPAASALLGYSKEELLTMHPWDFVTSVPRGEILATIDSLKNGAASSVQRVCRSKNGEEKVVSLSLRRNRFCGRDLIVATGRDVTQERRTVANLEKAVNERKRAEDALRRSEDYLRLTIDTIPVLAWCNRADGSNEFLNKRWLDYTGLSLEQGRGWGWQEAIHPDDLPRLCDLCSSTRASGESGESEGRLRRFDGVYRWFLFRVEPLRDDQGRIVKWYGTNTDIDAHKRSEAFLQGEKNLTEMIARGDSLDAILNGSCRLAEEAFEGSLAIVMLLDPKDNRLRAGAAPSFPDFMAAADGFEIDPAVGTCSAAAARKEKVITLDITKDANWAGYRELAAKHGLRAGWATPIFSSDNQVLGTFGLYWPDPRGPTPEHLQLLDQVARLVAFAIERKRSQDAISESEHLAQGQLKALTRTLDALAQESNPDRLLEHVLKVIIEQSAAHSVSVWGRDQDAEWVDLIAVYQNDRFQTSKQVVDYPMTRLPSSAEQSPIWSEILRTGQYAMLEDLDQPIAQMCIGSGSGAKWYPVTSETSPDGAMLLHQDYLRALGVKSILFMPMLIAGRVAGLIIIRFSQKRTLLRKEIELTRALAHQAMLALQLTRLSAQNRESDLMAERNRVARDIHDTLAQGFTGVIAQLEAARGAISQRKTARVSDHLDHAGELAREGLREARRSVQALRPQALEEKPLAAALQDMMERMTMGTPMAAKLTLQGEPRNFLPEWEANLLRIGQEALTNALRHARADRFDAQLAFGKREIRLELRDNGRGFDLKKRHEGFGLQGIKERTETMGGQFTMKSSRGRGALIRVVVPFTIGTES